MPAPKPFRRVLKIKHFHTKVLEAVAHMIEDGAEVRPHPEGYSTIRYSIKTDSPKWLKEMFEAHGLVGWGDTTIVELKVNLFSPKKKAASAGK